MKRLIAFALIATLAGCGDRPDMDFGGEELGPDRMVIHSEDGALRLGLTDHVLYLALSDSIVDIARQEMEDSMPREGIGGAISGFVRGGVNRALSFRAKYPIERIRDIRWEDGRMVVDLEDGERAFGDNFSASDDRPIEEAFAEADVRALADEFHSLKQRGGQ